MSNTIAKPVIKNKFWIVESSGCKIATIQAVDETGGFVYVDNTSRQTFPSIRLLEKQHNIEFLSTEKKQYTTSHEVYGYTCDGTPYNTLFDVRKQLPIFTKTKKSKSYHAAGHYIIKLNQVWECIYCPKVISLNRYPYFGPFRTKDAAKAALVEVNE